MQLRFVVPALVVAVAVIVVGCGQQKQAVAPSEPVLLAAPVGVTFQELRAAFTENDERNANIKLVFADSRGHSVYFSDKDGACDAACGEQWKPLTAAGDTSGIVATWSVVNGADGTKQWA